MKALLENREQQLTPGQFVNVSLSLDTLANAVVVPAEAVQQGPEGAFLFVVRPDSTVESRKIEVGASDRGLAAISKGIAADETVVTTASSGSPPAPWCRSSPPGSRRRQLTWRCAARRLRPDQAAEAAHESV
jgi:multidrug efflux system membrane fusion protein